MKISLKMLAQVIGGELVQGKPGQVVSFVSTDSRAVKPGSVFFALKGDKFDGRQFVKEAMKKGAKAAVVGKDFNEQVEPGLGLIKVNDPLYALGEFARYQRAQLKIKVVGVTGSVGKTTTKEMTALILSRKFRTAKSPGNFNNLIGLPLAIFGIDQKTQVAVLELASNQPGEISRLAEIAQPDIGVIVRIAAVHLQGLKDLEGVEREKRSILSALAPGGIFIFNLNDPRLCRLALGFAGTKIGFGLKARPLKSAAMNVLADRFRLRRKEDGFGQRFKVKVKAKKNKSAEFEIKGVGGHLIENALAAVSVGLAMGIDLRDSAAALKEFELIQGRGRLERTKKGVWLIDESYNANPESMAAALKLFSEYSRLAGRGKTLVLGEMAELGDYSAQAHRELGELLSKTAFNRLYYLGGCWEEMSSGLGETSGRKVKSFTELSALKAELEKELEPGELVMVKGSHITGLWQIADWLRESQDAL